MLRGSCLCTSVRYEIRGRVSRVTHCHCAMCRKAHGAAFATYGRVDRSDFAVVAGAEDIASYRSSPEVIRTFCKRCGSNLQFISDKHRCISSLPPRHPGSGLRMTCLSMPYVKRASVRVMRTVQRSVVVVVVPEDRAG